MGGGSWTTQNWNSYTNSRGINASSTVNTMYTSKQMKDNLNPLVMKQNGKEFRESCDSDGNPNSTAVIVGLDVTGSMGYLAEEIGKKSLNTLFTEIYDKKPITDPHLMFMAIGDAYCDSSPLQVSQFEADIKIAEQLMDIYFESGGGGNGGESYLLAWYFASKHTKIDCFEKHGRKGFLFTIGDECCHPVLTKLQIKNVFGDDVEKDFTAEELLNEVSRKYEVFHLVVGNHQYYGSLKQWKGLLNERAMEVTDHTKIPEVIESTMEVISGKDVATVSKQWDGTTSVVVNTAIKDLSSYKADNGFVRM
jgi:hypothetical protein